MQYECCHFLTHNKSFWNAQMLTYTWLRTGKLILLTQAICTIVWHLHTSVHTLRSYMFTLQGMCTSNKDYSNRVIRENVCTPKVRFALRMRTLPAIRIILQSQNFTIGKKRYMSFDLRSKSKLRIIEND